MKRVISFLLSIVMVISMLPVSAFATDLQPEETIAVTEPAAEETTAPETEEATVPETETAIPEETVSAETVPAEPAVPEKTVQTMETEPPVRQAPASVEKVVELDADNEENDIALQLYLEDLFYDNRPAIFGTAAREELTTAQQKLYDFLKEKIVSVAAGELSDTTFTVPESMLASWDVERTGSTRDEAANNLFVELAINTVIAALLHDCPYELYWFNKVYDQKTDTGGALSSMAFQSLESGDLEVCELSVLFRVVKDMQGSGYSENAPTVDTSMAASAVTAAQNAKAIAAEYKNASVYEKLAGFRDEICALVSYNNAAASASTFSTDADPWQLIWVFDGDSSTNVVCEGYSKAFQYLCDETGGIDCYTVTGDMDGGLHMWNTVTLDGKNYLVDITNSELGTYGGDGSLFLAGGRNAGSGCYVFDTLGGETRFTYDAQTQNLWGSSGILELADSGYEPPVSMEPEETPSNTCGENLTWTLEDGVLTISGSGPMDDFDLESIWCEDGITRVVIESGVTEVGKFAFANCAELAGVVLPETVTNIDTGAFGYCVSLTEIEIPDNTTVLGASAFFGCTALHTVSLPDGLLTIGNQAFSCCHALANVTIPATVTSIGSGAFGECISLTSIKIPEGVTSIEKETFCECPLMEVTIPASVTEIGNWAFAGCKNLTEIYFEGNVPTFGEQTFRDVTAIAYYPANDATWTADVMQNYGGSITWEAVRTNLTSGPCGENLTWTLEDGVLTISGTGAMDDYGVEENDAPWCEYADQITAIVIGDGVTSISARAFRFVGNMDGDEPVSLSIGEGLQTIGRYAFANSAVGKVVLPGTVRRIDAGAFAECARLYHFEVQSSEEADAELVFGPLGEDDSAAFNGCYGLNTIILGNTVKMIPSSTFHNVGMYNMEDGDTITLVLSDGLQTIGKYAFAGSNLGKVVLPGTVRSIGAGAFAECVRLYHFETLSSEEADAELVFGQLGEDDSAAFSGCYNLNTIILGNTVKTIPVKTFRNVGAYNKEDGDTITLVLSDGLQTIGKYAFADSNLGKVVLPGTVRNIGAGAFAECVRLYHFEVQSSEEADAELVFGQLGEDDSAAFSGCYNLNTIILGNTVKTIPVKTFRNVGAYNKEDGDTITLVLSDGLQTIGKYAFADSNLGKVVLPGTVRSIGAGAFAECARLYYFETLNSEEADAELEFAPLGEDDSAAFSGCYNLNTIILGNTVKTISTSTFRNVGAYNKEDGDTITLVLSDGLQTIGKYAFAGSNLGKVVLPGTVRSVGAGAFAECTRLYHFEIQDSDEADAELTFEQPDDDNTVYTFDNCKNLNTIILGNTVKDIVWCVFIGVGNSEEALDVTFSDSLETIDNAAFLNCAGLYSITIPASVSRIGYSAFAGTALQRIEFLGDAPVFGVLDTGEGMDYAFDGVTADGYHPANNPTWTDEVKLTCGGNITWVAVGEEESTTMTQEEFEAAIAAAEDSYVLTKSVTVTKNMMIGGGKTVTVADGAVLTLDSRGAVAISLMGSGSDSLAKLVIQSGGELVVNGSLRLEEYGSLIAESGAVITDNDPDSGFIIMTHNSGNYISGVKLKEFVRFDIPAASSADVMMAFEAAEFYQSVYLMDYTEDSIDYCITENCTIPSNVRIAGVLTIKSGCEVINRGIITDDIILEPDAILTNEGQIWGEIINQGGSGEEDNTMTQEEFLQLVNENAGTGIMLMLDKQVELTSHLVLNQDISIMLCNGGSLTANAGLTIGENAGIVVGTNGTMTVSSSLTTEHELGLQVTDGVLTFGEGTAVNLAKPILLQINDNAKINNLDKSLIYANAYVYNGDELAARIADCAGYSEAIIYVSADMALTEDITVPENTILMISPEPDIPTVTLTVPSGRSMTNNGHVTIADCATLLVEAGGTLVNNKDHTIAVFGTYINNGTEVNNGNIDDYNGEDPSEPEESAPSEPLMVPVTFINTLADEVYDRAMTVGEAVEDLPAGAYVPGYEFRGWYSDENGKGDLLLNGDIWYEGMPTTWYAYYEKSLDDDLCTLTIYTKIYKEDVQDRIVKLMSQNFAAGDNMLAWLDTNQNSICQKIDSIVSSYYTDVTWTWSPRNYCDISGGVLSAADLVANGNQAVYITINLEENAAQQPSDKCGENLTWAFDKDTGVLTISGTGEMYDYSDDEPWKLYKDSIQTLIVEEGVTSVDAGAFVEYSALQIVNLPSTVTSIGDGAFWACTGLQTIKVSQDNAHYLSEGGILFNKEKTVLIQYPAQRNGSSYYSIPNTVTEIARYAFYGCENLGSVNIPNGVKTIGRFAFSNCTGLGSIRIPDSVTKIDFSVFQMCTGLRRAIIGSGITDLNLTVFAGCTSLEEVELPDTLINIWEQAFAGCTSLTSITLPKGMNFISDAAFMDCTALEEIIIGGVKEIWRPFENCTALKKVVFLGDAPTYCTNAFQTLTLTACYPAGNATWTNAVKNSFGGTVTWVPMATSGTCGADLTWKFDSDGVLTISGNGAMDDYSSTNPTPWANWDQHIARLVIEDGVTTIGDYAFRNCEAMEKASIPASLTAVGDGAFHAPYIRLEIDQTVRQWSTVEIGADNDWFPGWDTTTFRNEAPIVASGIFGEKVFWELNEDGTLEAFGTGNMYAFGATGSCLYDRKVKNIIIGEGITDVGECVFEAGPDTVLSQSVETVTIASTVNAIGIGAFRDLETLTSVTFTGDAPTFGEDSFADVTATIYYPADNDTWTAAVMQNYGGNLTWQPMGPVMDQEAFDALLDTSVNGDGDPYITEEITLTEDVTLSHDHCVIIGYGGRLVVPDGVTLTITSELNVYGELYVEEGGALVLDNPGDENNFDDDNWLFLYVNGSGNATIDGSLTIGKVCSFLVRNENEDEGAFFGETSVVTNNGTLVAEFGGSITIDGTINNYQNLFSHGDLVLNGTLNNNGYVYIGRPEHEGILEVNGTLLNSGEIEVRENGVLKVHGAVTNQDTGYINTGATGALHVNGGTLDVTSGTTEIEGVAELILSEGSEIKGLDMGMVDAIGYPESYEQLAEMLGGNAYKSLLLLPECDITLENSIVIHENTQLILRDLGITLTVPDRRSLVNNGKIIIQGSSILWLENGSIFGGNMPEMDSQSNLVDERDRASHDWFVNQLKTVQNGQLEIHEDVTLAEDLVIPASVGEIVFRGKLIIPSGVTLTTYSRMGFTGGLHIAEGGELVLANDGTNMNVDDWGWLLNWIDNSDDNEINGTVTIAGNTSLCTHSTVNVGSAGHVVNNGTVSLENGTWNVDGSLENYNNLPVQPEAILYINDSGTLTIGSDYSAGWLNIYGRVDVYGTINNYDWIIVGDAWNEYEAELYIQPDGVLNNVYGVEHYGAVEVHSGSKLTVDGTVNNDGDIAAFTTGRIEVYGDLINNNVVRLDNFGNGIFATMDIHGILTNNAELYVVPGAVLNISGTLNNNTDAEAYLWAETNVEGTVNNSGSIEVDEQAQVNVYGTVNNADRGSLSVLNGTMMVDGELNNDGALYTQSNMYIRGTLCVGETGSLEIHNTAKKPNDDNWVFLFCTGTAEVDGSVEIGAGCSFAVNEGGSAAFGTSGIVHNEGTFYVDHDGSVINFAGNLTNECNLFALNGGHLNIMEGSCLNNENNPKGQILVENGSMTMAGTLNNNSQIAVVNGSGMSISGTVNNNGGFGIGFWGDMSTVELTGTLITAKKAEGVIVGEFGELLVRDGGSLILDSETEIDGSVIASNGGSIAVPGKLTNNGNLCMDNAGGDGGILDISGKVTNYGDLQVVYPSAMTVTGTLTNDAKSGQHPGMIQVMGDIELAGTLTNYGDIVISNPGTTVTLEITEDGSLNNLVKNASQKGQIVIADNGVLLAGGAMTNKGYLENNNLLAITNETALKNEATLVNNNLIMAKDGGNIVNGKNAVFENNGRIVYGEAEESLAVTIHREEAFEMIGGSSETLEAEILPGNVTNTKIEWTLSDPTLMTLKVKGNTVTVKAADVSETRTVILTAEAADGLALPDEIEITIRPEVKAIDIVADRYETVLIQNRETQNPIQLTAVVAPEGAAAEVNWTSSDEDVASVADGLVTFTGETGTATITATATDGSGVKASVTYKVIAPVDIHAHDGKTSIDLMAGKSVTLKVLDADNKTVKNVNWSFVEEVEPDVWQDDHTDYSAYVTLSSSGKLTAKKVSERITLHVRAMPMVEGRPVDAEIYTVTIYPTVNYVDILWNGAVVNGKNIYLDLAEGTELTLAGLLHPADAKGGVDWTSSNNKIATVVNGVVKPVRDDDGNYRTGTVTITATAQDGSKKKATVKVEIGALTKVVNIINHPATLDSGKSVTLDALTFTSEDTVAPTIDGVTWTIIEGADYAKIDAKGKLTAKTVIAPQKVVIVATSRDAAKIESAPVTITILPRAEENLNLLIGEKNVTKTTVNAEIGDTITISAMKFFNTLVDAEKWSVDWTVKGQNVTLSQTSGDTVEVKVNGNGKATITATGKNTDGKKVTATVTINVGVLSDGVKILSDVTTVGSGKSITLKAEAYAKDGTVSNKKVIWSLAEGHEAWAKISSSGKLTAVKDLTSRKTVTVRVEAQDGASDPVEIDVTITPLAQNVQIFIYEDNMTGTTLETTGMEAGGIQLSAVVYPHSKEQEKEDLLANQDVKWKSSNPKIVDIDEDNRLVFGDKAGTVTITATAQDGSNKKATFKIKTFIPVADLGIADAVTVVGGKTLKLSSLVNIEPSNASNKTVSYEIVREGYDGEAFATLTSNGQLKTSKVTGVKTLKIRAEGYCGYGMCEFMVYIRPETSGVTLSQENGVELTAGDTMTISATSLPVYPDVEGYAEQYTWKVTNAKDGGIVMEDGSLSGSAVASEITIKGVKPGKTLKVTATAMDGSGKKTTIQVKIVEAE